MVHFEKRLVCFASGGICWRNSKVGILINKIIITRNKLEINSQKNRSHNCEIFFLLLDLRSKDECETNVRTIRFYFIVFTCIYVLPFYRCPPCPMIRKNKNKKKTIF
uniref:Uncharacterized protein n=1 Tax=Anguilla anguilla TaxID=7936 RepID=A0A0E9U748_ANGAN